MPLPTITPLPTPPSRADATNFSARADTFLGALPTFQAEVNAFSAAVGALFFPSMFRNKLINGDFSVWQRGTSQTGTGYLSDDRWINAHAGSGKTHSRQAFALGQTAVPGEPLFFSRTVVSSIAGVSNFVAKEQRIESVRSFAGRNARVTLWAKADASRPVALELVQSFGTGGTPSANVTGIGAQKFNLTTAWQKFSVTVAVPSISGKTLGTAGDDYLAVALWFDAGSTFNARTATLGQQSGTFDIALVQVEEGTQETDFEFRPPAVELSLCQRYYWQVPPGTDVGLAFNASYLYRGSLAFPVTMRAAPTVAAGGTGLAAGSGLAGSLGTVLATPQAISVFNSAGNWTPNVGITVLALGLTAEL